MTDKSHLFITYWNLLAPQAARDAVNWIPEYKFHSTRRWRFDWALPSHQIAVEIDGANHMVRYDKNGNPRAVGRHTKPEDYLKMNSAASLGWIVFRFQPDMLTDDPHTQISLVLQALGYAPLTD